MTALDEVRSVTHTWRMHFPQMANRRPLRMSQDQMLNVRSGNSAAEIDIHV